MLVIFKYLVCSVSNLPNIRAAVHVWWVKKHPLLQRPRFGRTLLEGCTHNFLTLLNLGTLHLLAQALVSR